jgi:hypothetical protein
MLITKFNRWPTRRRPIMQPYKDPPYTTEVIQLQHITEEQRRQIAQELRHSNEQLELTKQYPGRRGG